MKTTISFKVKKSDIKPVKALVRKFLKGKGYKLYKK